jgi:hypothetical protein
MLPGLVPREDPAAGLTVVLFSTTHLLMRGLSGYVSDLSTEMNKFDRVFRGGILSIPGIPVLIDGCNSKTATREILEFGEWAKTTGGPNLGDPRIRNYCGFGGWGFPTGKNQNSCS